MVMTTRSARAKPDVLDENAPRTEFEGTPYVRQNGLVFDKNTRAPVPVATTSQRKDNVHYIIGTMGFSNSGRYVGEVDAAHGNSLLDKKAPAKPGAKKAPAKAPVKPDTTKAKNQGPSEPEIPEPDTGDGEDPLK